MMVEPEIILLDEVGAGVNKTLLKKISNIIKKFSLHAAKFQSGFIYQYAFIMLLGFSILLTFLIIK